MDLDLNVLSMGKEKTFTKESELMERLGELIDEYSGELSLVSVLGILQLKQICLIKLE
jgi:hypothetical protein